MHAALRFGIMLCDTSPVIRRCLSAFFLFLHLFTCSLFNFFFPNVLQICESVVTPNRVDKDKKFKFRDISNSNFEWDGQVNTTQHFDLYGYDAFPLGGGGTSCFCGWVEDPSGQCNIPQVLCHEKNLTECVYELGSEKGLVFTNALVEDWTSQGTWACPESDFSDSWGIVPGDTIDDWIHATTDDQTFALTDLLTFGMAGLRIGNIATLPLQAKKQGVHPGKSRALPFSDFL